MSMNLKIDFFFYCIYLIVDEIQYKNYQVRAKCEWTVSEVLKASALRFDRCQGQKLELSGDKVLIAMGR